MFRCNLPSALLAERPGSFTCHCGNTWMERTLNKSQHTKLTLKKKILPPLLPGFELATFRSRDRRFNQRAIPAPNRQSKRTDFSSPATHKTLLSRAPNATQSTRTPSSSTVHRDLNHRHSKQLVKLYCLRKWITGTVNNNELHCP